MLAALIDIRKVLSISIIVADPDRKWIAQRPLHLPAMNANRYLRMWRAMKELGRQRINISRLLPARIPKRFQRIEQNCAFARVQANPSAI